MTPILSNKNNHALHFMEQLNRLVKLG